MAVESKCAGCEHDVELHTLEFMRVLHRAEDEKSVHYFQWLFDCKWSVGGKCKCSSFQMKEVQSGKAEQQG